MAGAATEGGSEREKLAEYLAALHLHFTLPGADWCVCIFVYMDGGGGTYILVDRTECVRGLCIPTHPIEHTHKHRYELTPGGAQLPVTPGNVHKYLSLVARHFLVDSVAPAVEVRVG